MFSFTCAWYVECCKESSFGTHSHIVKISSFNVHTFIAYFWAALFECITAQFERIIFMLLQPMLLRRHYVFALYIVASVPSSVCSIFCPSHLPSYTIPYYPGRRGLDLPQTTLRPVKMAQCTSPAGMERRVGSNPGVGAALLLPLLLPAVHVCSVCKGQGGKIEGLVPIILWARPVRWVSLRPCTAYSAGAGFTCYPNAGSH